MSTIYHQEPVTNGKICLKTTVGDIDIELWSKEAPKACRNFIQLCMEGYYNGTIFHRVQKDFIVQGGDPTGTGMGGESIYGQPFKDEIHSRLKFNRRGMVGMANAGPNDNGSQFFFTLSNTEELQGKHTLFGKVVGSTLFNMLRLGEGEVDKNYRPTSLHKIIGATILNNPFDDIKPRELKKSRKPKEEQSKNQMKATKNFSLLSFGDEAEEEEQVSKEVTQKLSAKGKSAHDILADVDDRLSRELAVRPEELGGGNNEKSDAPVDDDEAVRVRERIRNKLYAKKHVQQSDSTTTKDEDTDLQQIIETEAEREHNEQREKLAAELKSMQRDYMRALRKPKVKQQIVEEKELTEGLQLYEDLRTKFKASSHGIVKHKDPNRENQTMELLNRFKQRLSNTNREAILFDRKAEIVRASETEEAVSTTSAATIVDDADQQQAPISEEQQLDDAIAAEPPGIDLDAEDLPGDDWMRHKFVAPEEDKSVSRAKDANLRETSEDWYAIDDPRNLMNQRRRAAEASSMDTMASAPKQLKQ